MTWISCPKVERPSGMAGWQSSGVFLGGGAYARRSLNGHRVYEFEWPMLKGEDSRKIVDFYEGVYGPGPFFWADPMAMDNLLPQSWATPSLGAYDAVPLSHDGSRPSLVQTSSNTFGFPIQSASFSGVVTPSNMDDRQKVWVPIPPGYTAHVYAWGAGAARVAAQTTVAGTATGSVQNAPWNEVTNGAPVPLSIVQSGSADGIFVFLNGPGSCIVTTIQVMLRPTSQTPSWKGFVSGQGHSGCEITDFGKEDYSAAMDKVQLTAVMTEVGQWL